MFTRAYTPNAKCRPSRACILTGRNSWQLKDAATTSRTSRRSSRRYAEALAEHGYFRGYDGQGLGSRRSPRTRQANRDNWPASRLTISKTTAARAVESPTMTTRPTSPTSCGLLPRASLGVSGTAVSSRIGATSTDRAWRKAHKSLDQDIDSVPAFWPDNEVVRNDMLDYAFEIEHFDQHLVRMLKLLEQQPSA